VLTEGDLASVTLDGSVVFLIAWCGGDDDGLWPVDVWLGRHPPNHQCMQQQSRFLVRCARALVSDLHGSTGTWTEQAGNYFMPRLEYFVACITVSIDGSRCSRGDWGREQQPSDDGRYSLFSSQQILQNFLILRHIESLDTCIKY